MSNDERPTSSSSVEHDGASECAEEDPAFTSAVPLPARRLLQQLHDALTDMGTTIQQQLAAREVAHSVVDTMVASGAMDAVAIWYSNTETARTSFDFSELTELAASSLDVDLTLALTRACTRGVARELDVFGPFAHASRVVDRTGAAVDDARLAGVLQQLYDAGARLLVNVADVALEQHEAHARPQCARTRERHRHYFTSRRRLGNRECAPYFSRVDLI